MKIKISKLLKRNALRVISSIAFLCVTVMSASAQKIALVDMDYILKNIPAYERANEQLNQVSRKWQAEVEALNTEAGTMYKNYQNEVVFLSNEQKKARRSNHEQGKGSLGAEEKILRPGG